MCLMISVLMSADTIAAIRKSDPNMDWLRQKPRFQKGELRARLRYYRTLFMNRWHAAITIGEQVGNTSIGERFEQINHASSLAEYLWRFGAFCEDAHGTGRTAKRQESGHTTGLRQMFAQLESSSPEVIRTAVYYTISKYGCPGDKGEALDSLVTRKLEELSEHGERIRNFASRVRNLQLSMLQFYRQMEYITSDEEARLRSARLPVTAPIFSTDNNERGTVSFGSDSFPHGDPVLAVQAAFGRNIYNALCWRARHELARSDVLEEWSGEGDFSTFAIVDGKRKRFTSEDPALISTLRSLTEPPFPVPVQLCCSIKRAVSTMITCLPVFIVRNFVRDTLAAFVLGRYRQAPVLATVRGSAFAVADLRSGNNEVLRDYLLQGGLNSGLAEAEIAAGPADELLFSSALFGRLIRRTRRVVYFLTRPAWVAEVGTRVTQYRKALAAGATRYEAIRAARMVSTDFANTGSSRPWRMYIGTVPFFNAALQGFDQLYQIWRPRYGRRPGGPLLARDQISHVQKALVAGLALLVATACVWHWNTTDPVRNFQYEAETEYNKSAYVTAYDIFGETDLRVPVPFQVGAVFMKLPEIALDVAGGAETLASWRFFGHLLHGNLSIGLLPAAIKPLWEIETNTNFFGAPVVPPYMQNWRPNSKRHYRSTLQPYRWIGHQMNVSPLQVETFVRGYTGHLGNLVMTGLDESAWDEEENGPKPFPRFPSYVTGSNAVVNPGANSRSWWMDYFYDSRDYYPRCAREEEGSCEGFMKASDRHHRYVNGRLRSYRERMSRTITSASYSRKEKEHRINELYANMHELAREYVVFREGLLKEYGLD